MRRAPRSRTFASGRGRGVRGEHANKLALYLKQLLGIAVTHGRRSGPERNDRETWGPEDWNRMREEERGVGERGTGGAGGRGEKEAKGVEAFRISSSNSRRGGVRPRRAVDLLNPGISELFEQC